MRIERLAILGVGLIGGSLARALKAAGVCGEVAGFGRMTVAGKKAPVVYQSMWGQVVQDFVMAPYYVHDIGDAY